MKVLILDGDPRKHASIAEILTKRGCDLLEVDDSDDALKRARQEKPEIAIVDVLTPKLDRGYFIRQLRQDPAVARMPVIFYTEGYLEIACGRACDVSNLLTGILICEEAIRGQIMTEAQFPPGLSDRNGACENNGTENLQQTFTFACQTASERTLIKPGELIKEMVDQARKNFPGSIQITSAYSEDLWQVQGDRPQLRRVLLNLFNNARAAMPTGGSLLVWANNFCVDQRYASTTLGAKPGKYVVLRVSDTGLGISRPLIDQVFNPFREDRVGPGTNLGMVRSHGGFISVYSELSRGTTFQIFLPAKSLKPLNGQRAHPGKLAIASSAL